MDRRGNIKKRSVSELTTKVDDLQDILDTMDEGVSNLSDNCEYLNALLERTATEQDEISLQIIAIANDEAFGHLQEISDRLEIMREEIMKVIKAL